MFYHIYENISIKCNNHDELPIFTITPNYLQYPFLKKDLHWNYKLLSSYISFDSIEKFIHLKWDFQNFLYKIRIFIATTSQPTTNA